MRTVVTLIVSAHTAKLQNAHGLVETSHAFLGNKNRAAIIEFDGKNLTPLIAKAEKKEKDDDDKDDKVRIEWIATEENNIGGWTGVAGGFALKVHCPDKDKPKKGDEPYVIVEIPEKAREQAKKYAKALGFPELPEGEIRVPITEKEQTALNDYFKDPELPKLLF